MKKIATIALGLCLLGTVSPLVSNADDADKKTPPTAEQKKLRKDMLEKYDANKDGKLDKEEKGKISSEDKEKMKKAGGHKKGEASEKKSDK